MYAFAGEASSGSADTDAVWTVEDSEGFILGNYNELQDAMESGREYDSTIILNRDASGKGAALALSYGDSPYFNFDFNGNTYTVTDGATYGAESERAAICLQGDEGHVTFKNGTLKIQNCEVGIHIEGACTGDAKITNFNIDASGSSDCANAVIAEQIAINGNSSVKVQPGNNAIQFWSDSTIDTAGTIQGKIVNKDEENYYSLRIYNGLFTEKPKDECIANGYAIKTENDGTFSVIPTEEWAPMIAKIKALQKEVTEAEHAMESDQKEMDDNMKQLETSVGAAEKALNDDIFEEDVDINKAISDAENSLKETQDKLKKTEEQLKNQNNKPTPSPTVAPVKKPGQVKGLKLKAGKKKVTVTYKKVSGATSYKVTYSTSKKFKKAKTATVKSGKTVKKTISKLKSKKTYYVKVCAVKKVKGKNYTGKWSAVKKVKVK